MASSAALLIKNAAGLQTCDGHVFLQSGVVSLTEQGVMCHSVILDKLKTMRKNPATVPVGDWRLMAIAINLLQAVIVKEEKDHFHMSWTVSSNSCVDRHPTCPFDHHTGRPYVYKKQRNSARGQKVLYMLPLCLLSLQAATKLSILNIFEQQKTGRTPPATKSLAETVFCRVVMLLASRIYITVKHTLGTLMVLMTLYF